VGLVNCGPAKRQVSDSRTARIFIDGFSESRPCGINACVRIRSRACLHDLSHNYRNNQGADRIVEVTELTNILAEMLTVSGGERALGL
jgi:hypothetical protein